MSNSTDIRWLAVGALAGLIAAGFGILRTGSATVELPDNALARVNDALIGQDLFERTLARLDLVPGAIGDSEREQLLQRLIDDELLVQRGVELGMPQSDLTVRTAIIDSLVASVTAEADAASPSDAELAQYLADNAERFSYTARLAVEAWETEDESTAQAVVAALRASESLPDTAGISVIPDLPPGLMPVEVLRDYIGAPIAAAAAEMPDGSSAIFARRGRWLVLRVVSREKSAISELDSIRNRVLLDYRRFLAEQALRNYLHDLRQRADLSIRQP